jgi:hypothetical protein
MRYGTVHSSGKQIIPLGDSLHLRFMISDYQKGKFWSRTVADFEPWFKVHYIDRRTYYSQIADAVKEGCQELFICIENVTKDYSKLEDMVVDVIKTSRKAGYTGELIISPDNEPLEIMSVTEYIEIAERVGKICNSYADVSLSIGGMASEFTGFYEQIAEGVEGYKYFDFHTSNDGNLWSVDYLVNRLPKDIQLICSEHYLMNEASEYGYDNDQVVEHFKQVTDYYFNNPRIKTVHVLFPSGYPVGHKYAKLLLREVDENNNITKSTKAWYMLKLYEKGEKIMAKLKELKKGDKGFDVLAMQDMLVSAKCDPKGVDGIFGDDTEKAVNKYRKKVGLKENGICSYPMWYFLTQGEETSDQVDAYFKILEMV